MTATHQVVDFGPGPGPIDDTKGYPFEGTERECFEWVEAHQETCDGRDRYCVQENMDAE